MRRVGLLAAVIVLFTGSPLSQSRSEPFFPMGVWYGGRPVPAPMSVPDPRAERDTWARDLRAIRSLGFNSIRNWVDWASVEPEQGRYRLDVVDQLLALSDAAGLKVILQLNTDPAPEWVVRRFPDAGFVTSHDARTASEPASRLCLDHPGVRASLVAFIDAVSARAGRSSALYALDVSSQPSTATGANGGVAFCYCAHTQRRFREWLQAKYGTLDALNQSWDRVFSTWDEVEAPRGTTPTGTDLSDWATFVAVKLQEDLKLKADASAARGARLVSSYSDAPAVMSRPLRGSGHPDDWWMSRAVDHYGTSIHPKPAGGAPWSPVTLSSAFDGIRSATRDRGWWLGELQAGQGITVVDPRRLVSSADLRLWGWTALARGARSISFYAWYPMTSGESSGYGMVDPDGTITQPARAAGEIAGIVSRNAALFAPLRPRPSRIAILYNPLSYFSTASATTNGNAVRDSMIGFYRAMFEHNIQVDFVHPDEILTGLAGRYRAIFLGFPLMLPPPAAEALMQYVRGGGTLISEARPASSDERGSASRRGPGTGLDEAFGVREKAVRSPETIALLAERDLDGPLAVLAGRTIPGKGIAQHLEITSPATRVLARFPGENGAPGDPAMVSSRYGAGRAVLIGTSPAGAFERDPDQARTSGELLGALAAVAGVTPEVQIEGGAGLVETRFLESSNALLLIGINHGDTPQRVTMRFSPDTPEAIWQNMETGASVSFVTGPGGPTHTHTFRARDVLVLMIGKHLR